MVHSGGGGKLSDAPLGSLILCITTKGVCLLQKDISRSYYYVHQGLRDCCGVCPTQAFCPCVPCVVWDHRYTGLSRLIQGVGAQMLALGFMRVEQMGSILSG